ncbi:MAG: EcsC family protein [Bacteroidetes bacterium]|nr:EcsC family protein [Bacteroidota bacterium]MCY4205298.1 EcsC family protein [Bacteroidota bacterium]
MQPSLYEERVFQEIFAWRHQEPSWLHRKMQWTNQPLKHLSNQVMRIPGVEWTLENLVSGLVNCTNEIVLETASQSGTLTAFRSKGYNVRNLSDIGKLDLEAVDDVLSGLDLRYQSLTAVHGAAAGFAGLAGLAADIVALVGLNLRATGQIALCCGYDISLSGEKEYALYVLNMATQTDEKECRQAYALAKQHLRSTIEQTTVGVAIRSSARALGLRLIRLKMAQIIPLAAIIAGGGFNAYYTSRVCETARHLYRERRLQDKYGSDVLASTSPHS